MDKLKNGRFISPISPYRGPDLFITMHGLLGHRYIAWHYIRFDTQMGQWSRRFGMHFMNRQGSKVNIRKPDCPDFEWRLTGRIFCPDFGFASLDRFGMNKIFFMTLFFIKQSRLVDHSKTRWPTIWKPDWTFFIASLNRFIRKES